MKKYTIINFMVSTEEGHLLLSIHEKVYEHLFHGVHERVYYLFLIVHERAWILIAQYPRKSIIMYLSMSTKEHNHVFLSILEKAVSFFPSVYERA